MYRLQWIPMDSVTQWLTSLTFEQLALTSVVEGSNPSHTMHRGSILTLNPLLNRIYNINFILKGYLIQFL